MILQTSTDITWIMGLAVMFGLALVMTVLTVPNTKVFIVWLNIFAGFVVWSGLLSLWVLVVLLIILTVILAMEVKTGGDLI